MIIFLSINFASIVIALSNTNLQTQISNSASKIVRERDLNFSITSKIETRISKEISIDFLFDKSFTILFKKIFDIERVANLFQKIDSILLIVEACQLLLEKNINNNKKIFVILFLANKNRFYIRCIYLHDKITIIATLDLILFSYYLLIEESDRLKLIDSKTIVEQVAIYQLKFILITS